MMQVDVCQNWRNTASLRCPLFWILDLLIFFQYPCLQSFSDQPEKAFVIYSLCQHLQQYVMVYVIKEAFNIRLYHVTKLAELHSYYQVT